MRKLIVAALLACGVAACQESSTGTVNVGTITWTATAAADVEVNAAIGVVTYLKAFEAQVPNAVPTVRAAGQALASAVIAQATNMVNGATPAVQGQQAAINAALALAPSLGTLLTTKQTGSGSAITVAADVAAVLVSDASYVLPAVAAANAGTVTGTTLNADEAALATAASAL